MRLLLELPALLMLDIPGYAGRTVLLQVFLIVVAIAAESGQILERITLSWPW